MDFRKFAEETAVATFGTKTETKYECPYCGNEMKGPIQPNEACCGEPGHAQAVEFKDYPCGCSAAPAKDVPDYCPEHGQQ